ncbi:hypothetical protein SOP86_18275 [Pseudomonas canadensis]|uniref:hypothetical protein n=1 Tax=Pseudomonas canadensis TaxID=915099 RepID=UPI002B24C21B|nr:hypothetical protein [Pseudomonas canadensis]MEB2647589.1 hypothetical protein [Pseudomonas canadensis]
MKRITMLTVKARDFVRFIDHIAAGDDICTVCGHGEWSVICPSGEEPTFRLGTSIRNSEELFYFSTFGYYCEKCGYLRQHAAQVVHRWVKDNPEEERISLDSDRGEPSENLIDE